MRAFVLVGGWPGSGKTTMARALADELDLACLSEDEVKEALMDALGPSPDVQRSRELGAAAVHALLRAARGCPGAVVDSTGYPYALPLVRNLPGPCVEVRCVVPLEVAHRGGGTRGRSAGRGGHLRGRGRPRGRGLDQVAGRWSGLPDAVVGVVGVAGQLRLREAEQRGDLPAGGVPVVRLADAHPQQHRVRVVGAAGQSRFGEGVPELLQLRAVLDDLGRAGRCDPGVARGQGQRDPRLGPRSGRAGCPGSR